MAIFRRQYPDGNNQMVIFGCIHSVFPIKNESSQANSLLKYSEKNQQFRVLIAIFGMLLARPAFLRFSGRFSDSVGGVGAVVGVGVAAF